MNLLHRWQHYFRNLSVRRKLNLLDYAAVAVPSGFMNNGLPWGVTLFGRAFTDQYLLSMADALQRHRDADTAPTG